MIKAKDVLVGSTFVLKDKKTVGIRILYEDLSETIIDGVGNTLVPFINPDCPKAYSWLGVNEEVYQ